MRVPSAAEVLAAWEKGIDRGLVDRGLLMLALVSPLDDPETLARLTIGERNRRLLQLRTSMFGAQLSGVTACTACGERLDIDFASEHLLAGGVPSDSVGFRNGDRSLRLRFPDSHDLRAASRCANVAGAAALLLERCIVDMGIGEAPSKGPIPEELLAEAAQRLADADPLADMRLALVCPACSRTTVAPFDVPAFLWTEIEAWAAHTLADVHVLAGAYGWTEGEILRLSDVRRQQYLQMVGA